MPSAIAQITRWRHRRNQAVESTRANPRSANPTREPIVCAWRAIASSHPARKEVTTSVIHPSNRSSGPGSTRSQKQPVTTTASSRISQTQPVEPICLGSGGGAPVGRRRRWVATPVSVAGLAPCSR